MVEYVAQTMEIDMANECKLFKASEVERRLLSWAVM